METVLHHATVKLNGYTLEHAQFGVYIKDAETGETVALVHNKSFNKNNDITATVARELAEYLKCGITIKDLFKTEG